MPSQVGSLGAILSNIDIEDAKEKTENLWVAAWTGLINQPGIIFIAKNDL